MPRLLTSFAGNKSVIVPLLTSLAERDVPRSDGPNQTKSPRGSSRTITPQELPTLYPDEHGINQVFNRGPDPL